MQTYTSERGDFSLNLWKRTDEEQNRERGKGMDVMMRENDADYILHWIPWSI